MKNIEKKRQSEGNLFLSEGITMSIMWKYLDKRKATIDAIKDFDSMQFIINNTSEEIKCVQDGMLGVGSPIMTGMPKARNLQAGEDRIIKALEEIDVLKERYRGAIEYMDWFKPAWEQLSEEERYILGTFYADEMQGAVYTICDKFNIERSSAYNKKNRALEKLTIQLYGKD